MHDHDALLFWVNRLALIRTVRGVDYRPIADCARCARPASGTPGRIARNLRASKDGKRSIYPCPACRSDCPVDLEVTPMGERSRRTPLPPEKLLLRSIFREHVTLSHKELAKLVSEDAVIFHYGSFTGLFRAKDLLYEGADPGIPAAWQGLVGPLLHFLPTETIADIVAQPPETVQLIVPAARRPSA